MTGSKHLRGAGSCTTGPRGLGAVLGEGGLFPNDEAIVRSVGAILLEQYDEWASQRALYMGLETIAALSDDAVGPTRGI
jgi:hypothetical protein